MSPTDKFEMIQRSFHELECDLGILQKLILIFGLLDSCYTWVFISIAGIFNIQPEYSWML